jgi:hypothetical protein
MLNGRAQQGAWPNNTMLVGLGILPSHTRASGDPAIFMMQAAQDGECHDRSILGIVSKSRSGRIGDLLLQALVRTCLVEVGTIGQQNAEELLLVQDQQMIQTFTTTLPRNRSQYALARGA